MVIFKSEKLEGGDRSKAELLIAQKTPLALERHLENRFGSKPRVLTQDRILWIGRQTGTTELFRTLALLLISLLAVSILAGCGGDDDDDEVETIPVVFVRANPPSGSEIGFYASITLTFDNPPGDIEVSQGKVRRSRKTVTVNGPFVPGLLNLTVTWADGTQTLTYTVAGPD